MSQNERRTVGERGQVTLPKQLREKFNIQGGEEVVIHEKDGKIVVEKPVTRAKLAEGYRERAADAETLTEEMEGVSAEANQSLGESPDW